MVDPKRDSSIPFDLRWMAWLLKHLPLDRDVAVLLFRRFLTNSNVYRLVDSRVPVGDVWFNRIGLFRASNAREPRSEVRWEVPGSGAARFLG